MIRNIHDTLKIPAEVLISPSIAARKRAASKKPGRPMAATSALKLGNEQNERKPLVLSPDAQSTSRLSSFSDTRAGRPEPSRVKERILFPRPQRLPDGASDDARQLLFQGIEPRHPSWRSPSRRCLRGT